MEAIVILSTADNEVSLITTEIIEFVATSFVWNRLTAELHEQ
jgi:hypothetical protein